MNPVIKPLCMLAVAYWLWGGVLTLIDINAPLYIVCTAFLGWFVLFGYALKRTLDAWFT